jgi:hypothetical protein
MLPFNHPMEARLALTLLERSLVLATIAISPASGPTGLMEHVPVIVMRFLVTLRPTSIRKGERADMWSSKLKEAQPLVRTHHVLPLPPTSAQTFLNALAPAKSVCGLIGMAIARIVLKKGSQFLSCTAHARSLIWETVSAVAFVKSRSATHNGVLRIVSQRNGLIGDLVLSIVNASPPTIR